MLRTIAYCLVLFLSLSFGPLFALPLQHENQPILRIDVEGCNLPNGSTIDAAGIKGRMKTREGDVFSQIEFDSDLKMLVIEYDRVEPSITTVDDKLIITLKIWTKPVIRSIQWHGNHHVKTSKLQDELEISTCAVFDRQAFNRAFHKLKTYYVKQGYFEAVLDYDVTLDPYTNAVDIEINICEGRAGRVKKILFENFCPEEEQELLDLIVTKKYNFLTGWYTGEGTFNEDAMQQDRFTILNYLQNKGYADAIVDIDVREACQNDRIIITVIAQRGDVYYFGPITFEGNTLFCDDEIAEQLLIGEGECYSPEAIRDTVKQISDTYGRRGYIDAIVDYEPRLDCETHTYSIHFTIEEGEQFRVGLVKVFGNCSTQTNVILHESLLIPGEIFNIIKLELTEERLENIGYFKNVNVYAVKSEGPGGLGGHYRDVHIEVEETMTGSFGAGFGLSSAESVFGEFNITERNFNYKGLASCWTRGLNQLRGGGEYLHLNAMIGAKSRKYSMSWTKPFFQDTPWIVGFEIDQSNNRYISQDYEINAFNVSPHGSFPLNQYLRLGVHYRLTNTYIDLNQKKVKKTEDKDKEKEAEALYEGNKKQAQHYANKERKLSCSLEEEARNAGLISAIGINLNYDSTNHPSCPTRGFRSRLEQEIAGFGGDQAFMGLAYLNTFYKLIGPKGVLKLRADTRFIIPLFETKRYQIPLNERLFLGGESTIRGYRVYRLGPQYSKGDPRGGMSLQLASAEYTYYFHKKFSAFVFCDSGHLSFDVWNFGTMWTSIGFGVNLSVLDNAPPVVLGLGFPLNPPNSSDVKRFFFNLGGQF